MRELDTEKTEETSGERKVENIENKKRITELMTRRCETFFYPFCNSDVFLLTQIGSVDQGPRPEHRDSNVIAKSQGRTV
jgi:hypothetical protein